MITNKDLSIDSENGKITLNGNKYDLGTQGEIDTAVKDVYSVMGQNGAKNLIPYPYYESDHTESGITWTVNSDGSVTANGTATANSTFIFRQRTEQTKFVEKNTSYILSGCPSGGSTAKYLLNLFVKNQDDTNVASGTDFGNGATINMPDQDYYGIYAIARVINGQTVSNLTFKPMLRLASDTDNTYQPYAMTNKQLTDTIGDITQTGVTGSSVAAQLEALDDKIDNTRIKTTAPVPRTVSFSNGEAIIALTDINPDAWEIVSVYAWGSSNALSFALSNWTRKEFKIFNLSNPTFTGNFDVIVVYHI